MCMFAMNQRYNLGYNRLIVATIHIKPAHSIVSYQWPIHQKHDVQKYDRPGHASPSGYGP